RIDVLLERQVHTNADGAVTLRGIDGSRSLVGRLHQPRSAARDDVAAHLGENRGEALDLIVNVRPRLGPRRAEDRYPIALPLRWAKPRQIIDDLPEAKD